MEKNYLSLSSRVSQIKANYKPGQNPGIARPAQDDFPTTYHWIEVDSTVKPSQE